MKKVLCIAECCCDIIFGDLPEIPQLGQEVYCREFAIKTGGGANTPMMLGRLGVPVRFLTGLGNDEFGRMIRKELEDSGVEIADTIVKGGYRTAVSAVLSTNKDRCFASYGGSDAFGLTEGQLREEIRKADIVHTFLGYCLHFPIAELCTEYGKELSLDDAWGNAWGGRAEDILRQCSYLKVNEEEAKAMTGKADVAEAAAELARKVKKAAIVTLGGKGSMSFLPGTAEGGLSSVEEMSLVSSTEKMSLASSVKEMSLTSPAKDISLAKEPYFQPIEVAGEFRDACGAGDSYAAGFLAGMAMGMDMKE